MHCYNEVSSYTLYRPTLYKQWQCIIQLLLPIRCWCIKCESYVRIFFRIYTRSCMTLVRRYFICAVLRNSSRTHRVRSRCMRDARPSLFIFAVLSAVLRSGFRDTDRYGHSYYRRRIGNCTQAFEWHQFQWPRVTCNPDFKVMISFNVE